MIPAVSDGQADIGMTGITIRDDRKEKVDFSDPYMRSEMRMLVRADEDRFTDAASFAADPDLLIGSQAGVTPFYVAVYDVLDGDEANPRIKLFETIGAAIQAMRAGDVDLVLTDSTGAEGYVRANPDVFKIVGAAARRRGVRLHLPQGLRPRGADQRRHRRDEGRRHHRRPEPEVVRRLPDRPVGAAWPRGRRKARSASSPGGSSPPAFSVSGSSPRSCSTRSIPRSSPSSPRASASPST